ncbi:hypothetical protein GJU39_16270 [Pedobacter petrophilus]|uniref:Thiopeptide-type bacteriocin biosynthesis domain-containing protein n=1 Tax=Pedobacter petrophilus TaxID=1908241 RepID=A0A7K0G1I5_9SPHI|nr:thiopeptide-type bacteriocin biosynthesis protein [Pedobacter petrophilus]MRX77645.1 hypothetical protein [Pedobacter petrophilus]
MDDKTEQSNYTWLGLHIYYSGDADELLKRAIAPFINQWKNYFSPDSPWFFIRYWEGGSHIRVRFHASPAYHEQIKDSLNTDFFRFQHASFKVEKVLTVKYDPEIDRYGNETSMAWAEQHFAASSSYILNWLLIRNTTSQITLQAIQLHLILLFSTKLKSGNIIDICDFFINGWLSRLYRPEFSIEKEKEHWLNQFQEAFSSRKEMICLAAKSFWNELTENVLNDDLVKYSMSNQEVMNQYRNAAFGESKFQEIISSLMHMTNNRLGIANQEEAYLMYVVKTCIKSIYRENYSN